jgi:hypothetical protein
VALCYVDEDVTEYIAPPLRTRGHDTRTTTEAGNKGFKDPRQLAFAAREGRVLITANRFDFILLHEAWLRWSRDWEAEARAVHAGILIVPSGSGKLAERLAHEVDRLLSSGIDLRNRLFRWHSDAGWQEVQVE